MAKYLIVGGVAAGMSAATRLKRLDETAEIIVFERGDYVSYANCGLPYYIGDTITERGGCCCRVPQGSRNCSTSRCAPETRCWPSAPVRNGSG
jgi:hypothetical protein